MTTTSATTQAHAAFEHAPSILWLRLHYSLGHRADVAVCTEEPCPAAKRAVVAFLNARQPKAQGPEEARAT